MIGTILLGVIGAPEWILIIAVVLLLFGGKKIPELMKGLGQGIKEFKTGMNGEPQDKKPESKTEEK
jgi:sec-independent protein translocase protein TatA